MSAFWSSPFNFAVGQYPQAKIIARNRMGQSATSQASTKDPNNAAQVQMQPEVMSPPTRGSDTSHTQV